MLIKLPAETVYVDQEAWAAEYDIPVEEVEASVIETYTGYCQVHITECLCLGAPVPTDPDQLKIGGPDWGHGRCGTHDEKE